MAIYMEWFSSTSISSNYSEDFPDSRNSPREELCCINAQGFGRDNIIYAIA